MENKTLRNVQNTTCRKIICKAERSDWEWGGQKYNRRQTDRRGLGEDGDNGGDGVGGNVYKIFYCVIL